MLSEYAVMYIWTTTLLLYMKGYIPVVIPTKKYIKAYIENELGKSPIMLKGNPITNKLYDLLEHNLNERKYETNARYNDSIKLYIPMRLYRVRGCRLNHTNIKSFNQFIEETIKDKMRFLLDFSIEIFPSFMQHLPEVRRKLGIDIEAWDDDSIRKDYYRYRKEKGLPPLYAKNNTFNKTLSRNVPSKQFYKSPC